MFAQVYLDPMDLDPAVEQTMLARSLPLDGTLPPDLDTRDYRFVAGFIRCTVRDHESGGDDDTLIAHFAHKTPEDSLILMRCLVRMGIVARPGEVDADGFWLEIPRGSPADHAVHPDQGETTTECSHVLTGSFHQLVHQLVESGLPPWQLRQAAEVAVAMERTQVDVPTTIFQDRGDLARDFLANEVRAL